MYIASIYIGFLFFEIFEGLSGGVFGYFIKPPPGSMLRMLPLWVYCYTHIIKYINMFDLFD